MLTEFVDVADIGVLKRGCGARFAAEALQRLRIATQFLRQELQCDLAAQLQVLGAIDHSHSSAADDGQHPIVGDGSANQGSGVSLRLGVPNRL